MHIALDIDDTITHAPAFFAAVTHALADAEITIVTVRERADGSEETLHELGIRYDRLVTSDDPELGRTDDATYHDWKIRVVTRLRPDVYFDDAPEVVHRIRPPTAVFMCCDDLIRGWLAKGLAR